MAKKRTGQNPDWRRGYYDSLKRYHRATIHRLATEYDAIIDRHASGVIPSSERTNMYVLGLLSGIRRCEQHQRIMLAHLYERGIQPQRGGRPLFACQPESK